MKVVAEVVDSVRPPPDGLVVLLYHRVGSGTEVSVDLPLAMFDEQMGELASSGRATTLDRAVAGLLSSEPVAGDVVVTFDDGTADFVDKVLPVLVHHGVPATLFVATEFIETQRWFPNGGRPTSWSALSDALTTGLVAVGSHTHTHSLLDRLDSVRVADELDRSIGLIEDRLGRSPDHFAYPKALAPSAAADAAVRRRFRSAALAGTRANQAGLRRSSAGAQPGATYRSPSVVRPKAGRRNALRGRSTSADGSSSTCGSDGMTTPRVVHVTTTAMSLDWLLLPQLEAFASAGYDVIAMSAPDRHVAAIEASGIEHVPIPALTRSVSPAQDWRALHQLQRAFREIAPDIVHTHNPKPGVLGRLAAKRAGVPVVVNTVHGLYATFEDRWMRRGVVYGLERVASACSDAELVQNIEDLETLRSLGVPDSKLTLLGNGVDLARFDPAGLPEGTRSRIRAELGVSHETVLVGAVGRLVWEKGYREVFAAAEQLEDRNCRFVVISPHEPGKTSAIGTAARTAAERVGVIFAGHRDDMAEVYSALDMYVLASYREGFPRLAMEASAMGSAGARQRCPWLSPGRPRWPNRVTLSGRGCRCVGRCVGRRGETTGRRP